MGLCGLHCALVPCCASWVHAACAAGMHFSLGRGKRWRPPSSDCIVFRLRFSNALTCAVALSSSGMPQVGPQLNKLQSTTNRTEDDELDAAEAFERMQLNALAASDPDSAVFHAARRHTAPRSTLQFKGSKLAATNARKKEQDIMLNSGGGKQKA